MTGIISEGILTSDPNYSSFVLREVTIIENIVFELGLDPQEFQLYVYYLTTRGKLNSTQRDIAMRLAMTGKEVHDSLYKLSRARKLLDGKSLINLRQEGEYTDISNYINVEDISEENEAYFREKEERVEQSDAEN